MDHLRENGFAVTIRDVDNVRTLKSKYRVPADLEGCHTALIGNYVIEGHVPADTIKRLLRERPPVLGLAVPGMPIGSPGMEQPDGRTKPYNVVSFDTKGATRVYERR